MEKRYEGDQQVHTWQEEIFGLLDDCGLHQIVYVPDGGHKGLIRMCQDSPKFTTTVLTTEEEGIGVCAGLELGGKKSALLMQSSGVGNCINMLSLAENCRMPLVMLIAMRGEWAEFVPWQISMGKRTPQVLEAVDVDLFRVDTPEEAREQVHAAIDQAYFSDRRVAVLLSQRLIGRKNWTK